MVDKVTLQILANHVRAAAENMAYTLYRTAHSTFVKETEDFTTMLTDPAGLTVAVPMDLGATWYPGINYGRAIDLVEGGYEPGDIAFTNDPYQRLPGHPRAGHPRLEAGLPRGRDRRLRGRPHPQHRHGRRRAGEPVAHADGDPPGGDPLPADEALSTRGGGRETPEGHAPQRPQAGPEPRRPQGPGRRAQHRRAQGAGHGRASSGRTRSAPGVKGDCSTMPSTRRARFCARSPTANTASPTTPTRTAETAIRAGSW